MDEYSVGEVREEMHREVSAYGRTKTAGMLRQLLDLLEQIERAREGVTRAVAEQVLTHYITACIDHHSEEATSDDRIDAMHKAIQSAAHLLPSERGGADGSPARHWHDLYRKECRLRQDDAARYGQQIIDLEATHPPAQAVKVLDLSAMVDAARKRYAYIRGLNDECENDDLAWSEAIKAALAAPPSTPSTTGAIGENGNG